MTKIDKENYEYIFKRFVEENTKNLNAIEVLETMKKLHRWEKTLNNKYIDACNRQLTEKEEEKAEILEKRIKEYVLENLGFNVKFNRDPRGCSIKIYLPSGRYNSLDGETWRINW